MMTLTRLRPIQTARTRAVELGLQTLGLLLLLLVLSGSWYLRTYFGEVTPDQIFFHLQHGGLAYVDPRLLWRTLRWGLGVVMLAVLALWLLSKLSRSGRRWAWLGLGAAAAASVGATVSDPCLPGPSGADFLAQHYVDPAAQQWAPAAESAAQRPDILVVFVESLDQAYTQPRDASKPLLPQLADLQRSFQTFGDLRNLSGAAWTVGGLFTALCGVPLGHVGLMSRNSLEYAEQFFRGGQCLTDVLAAQGWEAAYYGGASLRFAGKGQFLTDHSVHRRFGREQWHELGVPVPAKGWGLLDSELAERAWQDMNRPRASNVPRLTLLLTVNTHGPMGSHDRGCNAAPTHPATTIEATEDTAQAQDDDGIAPQSPAALAQMREALRCTDAVIAKLVTRFAQQADGRPKVIWIMGDHLNPQPLLGSDLAAVSAHRTVFHALARFDGQGRLLAAVDSARQFSHVDVMPTLAEAAGLQWTPATHRLGLGSSLLAPLPVPTLVETHGFERANGHMSCPSPLFQRLWFGKPRGA